MDIRTILSKIVSLIYRTRILGNYENDDLIKTILNTIKADSPEMSFVGNSPTKRLKETCQSLLQEKEAIPKEVLISQISILLENDQKLLDVLKDSISQDHDDSTNKRITTNLVKNLNNYYKEHLAYEIFSRASYDMKFNRGKIGNFSDYLSKTLSELEPLTNMLSSLKDPAVVGELDFENLDSVEHVFNEVKNLNSNTGVYHFGWQAGNRMCQGGVRRGETVGVGALQHKYKTGFTLSGFCQFATRNSPIMTATEIEQGKKPLLLRISFEDNLTNNLQFMYQYLKANEGTPVNAKDFADLSTTELTQYITKRLTATGFKIKMMRVDPSQWTYSTLLNKIIELEAEGYSVHLLMVDYLFMMPTTGCTQGPTGSDKRDMLRRVRNFCSARNTIFMTPFQLSTEAKQMLRNGVPDHNFLNEIAEKGYYDGCKTVDQELDLELYVHVFSHKRKKYLAVRRGKHRLPTVIADDDLFFMLRFPGLNIPVLEDLDGDDTSFRKLPNTAGEESASMLEELLG
ncbi:DnaB family ATPase [Flavobacterium sp.]|uniref:DnaB family ATPase n=1 Tax=Flavobacterium sp. TaxID=239 RepID=UPI0037C0DEC0